MSGHKRPINCHIHSRHVWNVGAYKQNIDHRQESTKWYEQASPCMTGQTHCEATLPLCILPAQRTQLEMWHCQHLKTSGNGCARRTTPLRNADTHDPSRILLLNLRTLPQTYFLHRNGQSSIPSSDSRKIGIMLLTILLHFNADKIRFHYTPTTIEVKPSPRYHDYSILGRKCYWNKDISWK